MVQKKRRLDRVLDPGFLAGLEQRSMEDVRAMRAECQEEEVDFSYERRLIHGRLAILKRELERRGGTQSSSLVEDLPSILADEGPSTRGAYPGADPNPRYDKPSRLVTKLVSDDTLAKLPELSDEELRSYVAQLEEVELEVSTTRRALHDVLDALNKELGRRYRSGEADPNDALTRR